MKSFLYTIFVCLLCILSSCEKHDGLSYFKSKCEAELNGHTYIDQSLFTISPDAIITPEFVPTDNGLEFFSLLRTKRGGDIAYAVRINLFTTEPDAYLTEEQHIEKVATDIPEHDYRLYCQENRISYAVVDGEIVSTGTFKITSYNLQQGNYQGTFTLNFSEGTLQGKFTL